MFFKKVKYLFTTKGDTFFLINQYLSNNNNLMNILDKHGLFNPIFCYHPSLNISGNCRMCLIEVNNRPKPIVACTTLYDNNIQLNLNSIYTQMAQESVMELLLINHPLDCPICDQGGECDLQENALAIGAIKGRFFFRKRGVLDSFISPIVTTTFTRCIHCTRCIRFISEISKDTFLGMLGRSKKATIGSYTLKKRNISSIHSNIVGLCPVGFI